MEIFLSVNKEFEKAEIKSFEYLLKIMHPVIFFKKFLLKIMQPGWIKKHLGKSLKENFFVTIFFLYIVILL